MRKNKPVNNQIYWFVVTDWHGSLQVSGYSKKKKKDSLLIKNKMLISGIR